MGHMKSDPKKPLIPLTVIPLSSGHCIFNLTERKTNFYSLLHTTNNECTEKIAN